MDRYSRLVLMLLLCIGSVPLWADVHVSGVVTDTDGYPVQGACVSFIDEEDRALIAIDSTNTMGEYAVLLADESGLLSNPLNQPTAFGLKQNFPNPFNPSTIISYQLDAPGIVRLDIYNILGQRINTLINAYQNELLGAAIWHGVDDDGKGVPAGIYLYTLTANHQRTTKTMLLLDGHYATGVKSAAVVSDGPFLKPSASFYTVQINHPDIVPFEQGGLEIDHDINLDFQVENQVGHYVSHPKPPIGPDSTIIHTENTYSVQEAICSEGHYVEYQFDWGNGEFSNWGLENQNYTYTEPGTYEIKVRVRCVPDPGIQSEWSDPLLVIVEDVEHEISRPNPPSTPETSVVGVEVTCLVSGAVSNLNEEVVYQIDWGDGSGWTVFFGEPFMRTHTYTEIGTYQIRTRARAVSDISVVSAWSLFSTIDITFGEHVVTRPYRPTTTPSQAEIYQKVILAGYGAVCSHGHSVEYQYDWADGDDYSEWGSTRHHYYKKPGSFAVKTRARCSVEHEIISEWSAHRTLLILDALGTVVVQNTLYEPVQVFKILGENSVYIGDIAASDGITHPDLSFELSGGRQKILIQSVVTFGLSKLYRLEVIPHESNELIHLSW